MIPTLFILYSSAYPTFALSYRFVQNADIATCFVTHLMAKGHSRHIPTHSFLLLHWARCCVLKGNSGLRAFALVLHKRRSYRVYEHGLILVVPLVGTSAVLDEPMVGKETTGCGRTLEAAGIQDDTHKSFLY